MIASNGQYGLLDIPDKNKQACTDCHSPLVTELEAYDFKKSDYLRRAELHFSNPTGKKIATLLLELRQHSAEPWFSTSVPPLQPGGAILTGDTALNRDWQFAKELKELCPLMFGNRIGTLFSAKAAAKQLLKIDLSTLKIGIRMNRLSQDSFHGANHATVADWIPDVPVANDKHIKRTILACQQDPVLGNFQLLDHEVSDLIPKSGFQQLAIDKYRALIAYSFGLKRNGRRGNLCSRVRFFGNDNPFWNLGNVARILSEGDAHSIGIPANVIAKKSGPYTISQQLKSMILPWLWLGWIKDPTLRHSGLEQGTRSGAYFCQALWDEGPYPTHMIFMMQRRMLERWFYSANWRKGVSSHYELAYSYFLIRDHVLQNLPTNSIKRKLIIRFYENCFRVSLWLLKDDLERSKTALRPYVQVSQIHLIEKLFKRWRSNPKDLSLCRTDIKLLQEAKAILQ